MLKELGSGLCFCEQQRRPSKKRGPQLGCVEAEFQSSESYLSPPSPRACKCVTQVTDVWVSTEKEEKEPSSGKAPNSVYGGSGNGYGEGSTEPLPEFWIPAASMPTVASMAVPGQNNAVCPGTGTAPCAPTFGWSFPAEHSLLLLCDVKPPNHISQRRLEQLDVVLLHLDTLLQ